MKGFKRLLKRKVVPNAKRGVAFHLALILLFECAMPSVSFALTGGPSQPEVQSFEPIGTSDMVDLFSGDFSYNIPLIDVEGYPINLSYHSGITMDQEASWCGLGWNVNPGTVNRNMRGIPDDFAGEAIKKEFNIKPNTTIGVSTGLSGELFGLDFASFNARIGMKYNNYTGVGIEKSFNVSISASNKAGGSGSVSLGITSSSDEGLTLQPNISLSAQVASANRASVSAGVSIGASFNSRSGLSNFTVGANISYSVKQVPAKLKVIPTESGFALKLDKAINAGGGGSTGASASFDFGGATYSPSADMPMENVSISGNFKLGGEVFGFDGSLSIGGYYTSQSLGTNSISSPAFGYMNTHLGQNNEYAMLDFNREKDGAFNLDATYNLPLTNFTYDLYTVSGQGTGGSYRPMRSDIGHVFDPAGYSTSNGADIGVEVGLGNLTHVGVSVTVNELNTSSGDWGSSNISSYAQSRQSANYNDYEPFYFKEANEKSVDPDQNYFDNMGGDQAARFDLDGSTKYNAITTGDIEMSNSSTKPFPTNNFRSARDRKTQVISTLSNSEIKNGFGLNNPINNYVINHPGETDHHIGQISSLGADGKRYIYGLPAYNTTQEETSFAVGVPEGGGSARPHSAANGTVTYVPGTDNSTGNGMGLDNYFNNITMPAFAHSYLLTAVVSADYVDSDNIKGPSDGDLGTYVKFNYNEATAGGVYKWRTPLGENTAKYNDGLFSNENDDKGSYVYGEKQLYYLNEIETKNYKAVFTTSDRADALGVLNKNGKVDAGGVKQKKLDKIQLLSKASGAVIKTVHFQYDYELAKQNSGSGSSALPNNKNGTDPQAITNQGGKLTLKKVYFTYQNSEKGAFNAYNFKYAGMTGQSGLNPSYDLMSFDRWGNYKASNPNGLPLDVFPYCNQTAPKQTIDDWSYAWHLTKIELPSGGEINVNYESDDYAYVQNEQATQMYPVAQTNLADFLAGNLKFAVPLSVNNINELLPDDNMMAFRFLMEIANGKKDYVPGYVEINRDPSKTKILSPGLAQINVSLVTTNDNSGTQVNPIIKAAIQFGRLNNSRLIWDQPNASANMSEQVLKALVNSSFFTTIEQTAKGPNEYLYGENRGKIPVLSSSWIKLKNTTGFKYGGGNRVKSVILNDKFSTMVSGADESEYGQVYDYTTKNNVGKIISSGVAPYEPQIGGEENALKHPFFTDTKKLLAPDDEHYVEAPFGESFYPSPGVGYSKVSVKNYVPSNLPSNKTLKRHATGYVVHEFYTAKEFPTITDRTLLEAIQHKNDPFSLASLFHIESKDYMTTSQGFYIELNDMHGKPKIDYVYGEDQVSQISSTEYKYKSTPYGNGCSRLQNNVDVIYPDGTVKNQNIGLFFDAVGDLRQQETDGQSFGLNVNVDGFMIAAAPVFIPIPIPSYTSDKTRFRSAVLTKVVQRFGILEETISNQDGSIVTTKNLAYDAENGQVILTQLNNNFEDPIFAFKYPAYWYYAGMAAAYRNIDFKLSNVMFNGSGIASLSSSDNKFVEGDELEMLQTNVYVKGWVTAVTPNSIEVQQKDGTLVNGLFSYIKVIRSGARNLLGVDMANITSMVNPLNGIKNNIYDKVIQASSVEFGNRWRTVCECNTAADGSPIITNPYVNGTKGVWRPLRNYLHLTGRNQNDYNNNTNIRKDGFFTSYTPFYKLNPNGKWSMDPQNWTYASDITEFNPYGQELENVDALGRYSAATFGFNQTMATSVAANTQHRELGFDSFEDYNFSSCADRHFKFGTNSDNTTSHTGRRSINVPQGTNVSMEKQIGEQCTKETTCRGYIDFVSSSNGVYSYTVTNSTGPYNLDVVVVSGNGSVQPTANGFSITPVGNSFTVKITLMDANGCTYKRLIQYPYNN